jgi:hypothetical protein
MARQTLHYIYIYIYIYIYSMYSIVCSIVLYDVVLRFPSCEACPPGGRCWSSGGEESLV